MHNRSTLEQVRSELKRRGMPSEYVGRVVDELRDHQADVVDEQQAAGHSSEDAQAAADARLGDPQELIHAAVSQYQGRTFCGRHPVLSFVLAPIPAVILAWISVFLAAWCVLFALDKLGLVTTAIDSPQAVFFLMLAGGVFDGLLALIVPGLVAYWLCRRAHVAARAWPWIVIACGLVALMAAAFQSQLDPPIAGPGTGRYMIGLGAGTAMQWTHALVPLLIGCYFICRRYMDFRSTTNMVERPTESLRRVA